MTDGQTYVQTGAALRPQKGVDTLITVDLVRLAQCGALSPPRYWSLGIGAWRNLSVRRRTSVAGR